MPVQNFSRKKVLVCPLDWGFGHATRCIPIIRSLIQQQAEVIIAAAPSIKSLLQNEFPNLECVDVFGYDVKYSSSLPLEVKLILQVPRLLNVVKRENEWLDKIIDELKIDTVVSDNRYGLYSKKAHCIFITHQLFIPAPVLKNRVNKKNHSFIGNFNECWVPDHQGAENLSGELSHGEHRLENVKYIGPLSRFSKPKEEVKKKYDYCFLLSGVEPQRSILEKKLLAVIRSRPGGTKKIVFIRGIKDPVTNPEVSGNIELYSFLNGDELQDKILKSDCVICRSGYSGIMDLAALNKKAILIPTPGQNEQEYLAHYLANKPGWQMIKQSKLSSLDL